MNLQQLLDKHNGDALKAMAELESLLRKDIKDREDENFNLRKEKREMSERLDKAEADLKEAQKQPTVKDGEVVISGEDATLFNEVKSKHGGLKSLNEKYEASQLEKAKTEREAEELGYFTTLMSVGLREDAKETAFKLLRDGQGYDPKYVTEKEVDKDGSKVKTRVLNTEKFKEDNAFLFGDGRRTMPKNKPSGAGAQTGGAKGDHISSAVKTARTQMRVPDILIRNK